jgi:type IV pilus assembly protein PilE
MNLRTALAREKGFTLIELMITVAVIAILASIAYPAYTEQIAKSRRAQAKGQLLAAQQWMERFYSENYRYDKNSADSPISTDDKKGIFDARFSTSPPSGEGTAMYNIVMVKPYARDTYVISATRVSGSAMGSDRCGDFTIDHLGRKSIAAGTYDAVKYPTLATAISACWN